jgi:hypothetical protein
VLPARASWYKTLGVKPWYHLLLIATSGDLHAPLEYCCRTMGPTGSQNGTFLFFQVLVLLWVLPHIGQILARYWSLSNILLETSFYGASRPGIGVPCSSCHFNGKFPHIGNCRRCQSNAGCGPVADLALPINVKHFECFV